MNHAQNTFGNQHDWAAKKMKIVVTNPEGPVTLTPFDDQHNRMEIAIACFPEIVPKNAERVLKMIKSVFKEHGECPTDENFWTWYVKVRKCRVATMHRDFLIMFRYLQMSGYYSKSFKPALLNYRLKQRDGVKKIDTILTEDEIAYVIRKTYPINGTVENRIKQKALDIFVLSLFTGARVSDVRTIVKSIDEKGNPVLLFHNHKGTRSQALAWNEAVEGPLQRGLYKTQAAGKLLYPALKAALYEALPTTSNRVVNYYYLQPGKGRELRNDSRISHISFHTARHTFCTRLLRAGIPIHIVCQLAGHKNIQTTMKYYNWTRDTEANDVLRSAYGAKTVVASKPNWGEGANTQPLPLAVHKALFNLPTVGKLLADDGGLRAKLKNSMPKSRTKNPKKLAILAEIKRRGL